MLRRKTVHVNAAKAHNATCRTAGEFERDSGWETEMTQTMDARDEIVEALAGFSLFGDLTRTQLQDVAHRFEEAVFPSGERILRQGLTGSGFYVILEGEAAVVVDGEQRATLSRGEFFGEVSVLLNEPPVADVVALRPLRCLVLSGPGTEPFFLAHPRVMFRMLQAQARRLRNANRWRS
jgi:CRP-like cAMP-binding protein